MVPVTATIVAGWAAEEFGGHQGEAAARIIVGDQHGALVFQHRPRRSQHSHGAARDRVADEAGAIGLAARQSGEQVARPHGARIGGQAGDLRVARERMGEGLPQHVTQPRQDWIPSPRH